MPIVISHEYIPRDPCTHHWSTKQLERIVNRRGHTMIRANCEACGDSTFVAKSELWRAGVKPHEIPVAQDNSCPFCGGPGCPLCAYKPCERCNSTEGVELHHWAPKALFGHEDADSWPTSHLCRVCHALWHRIVTPDIAKKRTA